MKKLNNKKIILLFLILFFNISIFSMLQSEINNTSTSVFTAQKTRLNNTELFSNETSGNTHTLYKVMLITLIIWIGLSVYIFYLNNKVKRLEKKLDEK